MPLTGVKVKLVPLQITVVKLLTAGRADKKTKPEIAAEPPAAVRLSDPVAPEPTTAIIVVEDSTWKDATDIPPNEMATVFSRFVPNIVMVAPIPALDGENELIVGTLMVVSKEILTVKLAPIQLPAIGLIVKVAVCFELVALVSVPKILAWLLALSAPVTDAEE